MKQKRTAKTKALKEETSNVYGNGHTSLFADVIDAIQSDRKPYVDAVAGRNASGSRTYQYTRARRPAESVKLPLTGFCKYRHEG